MTTSDPTDVPLRAPGSAGPSDPRTVELVALQPVTIHALAAGDLDAANVTSPAPLTAYLVESDARHVWGLRSRQVDADPATAQWVTGLIVDPANREVVGRAGFHGPPDAQGMVEVGYSVDPRHPRHRRRGYARAALRALLDRARREPSVRVVRATISPDNAASRSLVLQHGFVEVGEQWDDEDGLEIVFEVPA
ncbi:GNAT family N-acetyltransferase [Cellulomonas chengniuliangii]|uniref:GNAT family N-acetyltransferase n=1 Tax=Cellulomonas chengniuliangii TaxID=2968084 RepID=UPI001D0F4117|nr:GNAT family N-acetyltransferase [Cellulomonas chengniuliangii]MCC2318509.1 GNAT family N-acetyltransferase [Cellulomonas chengniuliangii]